MGSATNEPGDVELSKVNNESQVTKSKAAPTPLQQSQPVAGLLEHPIYFRPLPLLHPAIRPEYSPYSPRQVIDTKEPVTSKAAEQLHVSRSFQDRGSNRDGSPESRPRVQPNHGQGLNMPPTRSLPKQHQVASKQDLYPNVLPIPQSLQHTERIATQVPSSSTHIPSLLPQQHQRLSSTAPRPQSLLPTALLPQQQQRLPSTASRPQTPSPSSLLSSRLAQHQLIFTQAPSLNTPRLSSLPQQHQGPPGTAPRSQGPPPSHVLSSAPQQHQRLTSTAPRSLAASHPQQYQQHASQTARPYAQPGPPPQEQGPHAKRPRHRPDPTLMLPPPVPQRHQGSIGQNPTIRSTMAPKRAQQPRRGRLQQRSHQMQPSNMPARSTTPPDTPTMQQPYGPVPQYGSVSINQAPNSNTAPQHAPSYTSPYGAQPMHSQPYDPQFQPNQSIGPYMSSPPVANQQRGQQQQYHSSPPNQMSGSNMLPPPLPHQPPGFAQSKHGSQQQEYPQVQSKTIIKLNLAPSTIPQPQVSPVPSQQSDPVKNPFDHTTEEVVKFLSKPFSTVCFMSTDQVKQYIVPHKIVPKQTEDQLLKPEPSFIACTICPEWFWGESGVGEHKYCIQCVVDMFEREWKLRTVLRWTQLYQQWCPIIEKASLGVSKKAILLLELRVRLVWLNERQEFIHLESTRMASELALGHQMDQYFSCKCQGLSVWLELKRPRSGLICHQDSNLGVTFGDPVAGVVEQDSNFEVTSGNSADFGGGNDNDEYGYYEGSLEEREVMDVAANDRVDSVYPDIWQ